MDKPSAPPQEGDHNHRSGPERPAAQGGLGKVLVEGAMIMFAVLLALAVDQWWQEREYQELAERATEAIVSEIRTNLDELQPGETDADPEQMMADVNHAIATYRAGEQPQGVGVTWNVSLLSSAAWETAQVTRATQHIPLERLIDLAKMYEFQHFFTAQQDDIVKLIANMASRMETEPVATLIEFESKYLILSEFRDNLMAIYACRLVDLLGPTIDEAAECPAPAG